MSDPELVDPGGSRKVRPRVLLAVIAVLLLVTDQITKQVALTHLDPRDPPEFLGGFFRLWLVFNPGAAFSLGTSSTLFFSILAMVVLALLVFVIAPRVRSVGMAVVVGLGIAGVGGNFIDRVVRDPSPFRGHVIDFLSFGTFPVFNVADMCLTSAAGLMILLSLRPHPREQAARPVDHVSSGRP
ncbi:signal peptidase II [Aestuariimicrobium sp. T2.26MG-19.2B]|uniref:signal peptidase II n=1 Tax=Aestuariimicrobium sp. T2.26MG-19.2B TaxID=3040679 RepID=UPI0025406B81|nr:signal peptidase II [Aestuariimicrobium sp. T2.26MG-19.2B]